jgi:hypothetical protein
MQKFRGPLASARSNIGPTRLFIPGDGFIVFQGFVVPIVQQIVQDKLARYWLLLALQEPRSYSKAETSAFGHVFEAFDRIPPQSKSERVRYTSRRNRIISVSRRAVSGWIALAFFRKALFISRVLASGRTPRKS